MKHKNKQRAVQKRQIDHANHDLIEARLYPRSHRADAQIQSATMPVVSTWRRRATTLKEDRLGSIDWPRSHRMTAK